MSSETGKVDGGVIKYSCSCFSYSNQALILLLILHLVSDRGSSPAYDLKVFPPTLGIDGLQGAGKHLFPDHGR